MGSNLELIMHDICYDPSKTNKASFHPRTTKGFI